MSKLLEYENTHLPGQFLVMHKMVVPYALEVDRHLFILPPGSFEG